ncbi:MAG: 30S ribosomal protein S4, partial [Christensenellaceae bacterium]|nr:30S ribosomal protein S4 [Christensenellaceae bacterium]
DAENLTGSVLALPQREDAESSFAEHLVVEYYSK